MLQGKVLTFGMKSSGFFLTTALISGLIAFPGFAQSVNWEGTVSTDYTDPANWTGGALPTAGETAVFLLPVVPTSVDLQGTTQTVGGLFISVIDTISNGTFLIDNGGSAAIISYADDQNNVLADTITFDLGGSFTSIIANNDFNFGGDITTSSGSATLSLFTNNGAVITLSGEITGDLDVEVVRNVVINGTANTYTGTTEIFSQTLTLGQSGGTAATLGSGEIVLAGGTLRADDGLVGAQTYTLGNDVRIDDASSIIAADDDVLQFTGAGNSFEWDSDGGAPSVAALTIGDAFGANSDGTVILGFDTVTVTDAAATAVIDSGTVVIGNGAAGNGMFNGIAGTTMSAGATLDLNGHNTTITDFAGAGTVTNNGGSLAQLIVNGTDDTEFSGTIQDGLSQTGLRLGKSDTTDTFTLSGANTFTGITTVQSGALVLQGGSALNNDGAITLVTNGTLQVDASEDVGMVSGGGSINLNGAGVTLTVGAAGGINVGNLTGLISGDGNLTLNDADNNDTLTLSGTNTYTGITRVESGRLQIASAGALGSSDVTLSGGTLSGVAGVTLANDLNVTATGGTLGAARGQTLVVTGDFANAGGPLNLGSATLTGTLGLGLGTITNTAADVVVIAGGTVQVQSGTVANDFFSGINRTEIQSGATLDVAGNATTIEDLNGAGVLTNTGAATNVTLTGDANLNFSGAITGDGANSLGLIVDKGASNVTLLGNSNTFDGGTEVASGTLLLNGGDALLDTGAVSMTGGTLGLLANETIGDLSGNAGLFNLLNSTLTFGGANDTEFGAIFFNTGASAIVKQGSGTFTLNSDNSARSFATSVTDGTFVIAGTGGLGTGGVNVTGGTLTSSGIIASGLTNSAIANLNAGSVTGDVINTGDLNLDNATLNRLTNNTGGDVDVANGGTINTRITNSATLDLNSGTLTVTDFTTNDLGGVFTVASGATLASSFFNNPGGTLNLNGTLDGQLDNDNSVITSGTATFTVGPTTSSPASSLAT